MGIKVDKLSRIHLTQSVVKGRKIFDNLSTFIPIKVNNLSTFIAECARSAQEKNCTFRRSDHAKNDVFERRNPKIFRLRRAKESYFPL